MLKQAARYSTSLAAIPEPWPLPQIQYLQLIKRLLFY